MELFAKIVDCFDKILIKHFEIFCYQFYKLMVTYPLTLVDEYLFKATNKDNGKTFMYVGLMSLQLTLKKYLPI